MKNRWVIAAIFIFLLLLWIVKKTGSTVAQAIGAAILPIGATLLFASGVINVVWWIVSTVVSFLLSKSIFGPASINPVTPQ